ncbi:MAG: hypothetical protein II424_07000 [Bacteroidales bacterium]|nr:hypothetical protein [Bacteroidales bacterium]
MKKAIKILAVAVLAITAAACSSAEKMAELANNVVVTCNPTVLEVVAGNIDATLNVTYPEKYFHPKALLQVTPVLVYEGGEQAMTPFMYQGEKVKDNYKVVPAAGGTVTERVHFTYVPGMEKAYLELRGVASYKTKAVTLPTRKVADGCNTTYMLVKDFGNIGYKADNYQDVIPQTAEGQILYTINSADVRAAQLKGQSITDFQAALDEINANSRKTLKGTEIVAYASPDGGESLNDKLSDKRAGTAEKAWAKVVKGHEATDPAVKSIGEDWEGFKELVSASNMQDKDLILRVLSMYSDPNVREREIKNMSSVYKSLADNILPELRRARFITNVEFKNYTPEELTALVSSNIDVLDEEALLRAATLVKDPAAKQNIYRQAIQKFGSDRARFNSAVEYLNAGDLASAKSALSGVKSTEGCVTNLKGVVAMREGNLDEAARLFASTECPNAKINAGTLDILNGNYAAAAQKLAGTGSPNEALAYILTGQLDKAAAAVKGDDARAAYERAIIAARRGDAAAAQSALRAAGVDRELAARIANDVEFAKVR